VEPPALHHDRDVGALILEETQVLQWVAVDHQEIGEGARRDDPEVLRATEELGADDGRRVDDLARAQDGAPQQELLRLVGLQLTEQIVLDDGAEAGVWLAAGQKSYDVTYTRDLTRTPGRLHHLAFFVAEREDVLRAADIFLEHGIVMESGPHKHAIQQTFFLYTWEPGGNRVEICSGGYLIFAPDHEAVVWSQAERAKGQAWGMQTVASFHIKGTPPVPEEEALLASR